MATAALPNRRPALLSGLTGLALAGLLLTGCGGSSSSDSMPPAGASSEIAIAESAAAESDPAQDGAVTTAAEVPEGWPAEVLVPAGNTVLTTERGGGWDLLIEGIDEAELKALIERMTAAGFTTPGITDMGSGAWIAELTGPVGVATYAYETGGAGLPNVRVVFTPTG